MSDFAQEHAFIDEFLPLFERNRTPTDEELGAFCDACYGSGMIIVFDWPEWEDQGHVLLETSGAMERTDLDDLRRLLTMLVRQEKFDPGTLAHAVSHGWFHVILERMRTLCSPAPA